MSDWREVINHALASGDMLWHASRLSYGNDTRFSNNQIANCDHVKEIFKDTRILEKEPDFLMKVCKRTRDAASNHPVLIVGQWRQGKSSLVSSLMFEATRKSPRVQKNGPQCRIGRRSKTTSKVDLYGLDGGEVGTIWLADTPGLEPDETHDIMGGLREELERRNLSVHVFTDILVLVIAGTPQGLSDLSSETFMRWIKNTYAEARQASSLCCTILPVVTHGDFIDENDRGSDIEFVRQRLEVIACDRHQGAVSGTAKTVILHPLIVTNHKWSNDGKFKKPGENIQEVLGAISAQVSSSRETHDFRLQWSRFLTEDLERTVLKFHSEYPDDETERRLFHRTLEAILATYNKKSNDIGLAFPKPAWALLAAVQREMRGELTPSEKGWRVLVSMSPIAPSSLLILPVVGLCTGVACKIPCFKQGAKYLASRMPFMQDSFEQGAKYLRGSWKNWRGQAPASTQPDSKTKPASG